MSEENEHISGTESDSKIQFADKLFNLLKGAASEVVSERMGEFICDRVARENYARMVFSDSIKTYLDANPSVINDVMNGNVTDEHIKEAVRNIVNDRITDDTLADSIDETIRSEVPVQRIEEKIESAADRAIQTFISNNGDHTLEQAIKDRVEDLDVDECASGIIRDEVQNNVGDLEEIAREMVSDQISDEIRDFEDLTREEIAEKLRSLLRQNFVDDTATDEIRSRVEDELPSHNIENILGEVIRTEIQSEVRRLNISELVRSQLTLDNPEFAAIFEDQIRSIDWKSLVAPELNGFLADNLEVMKKDNILRLARTEDDETQTIILSVKKSEVESIISFLKKVNGIQNINLGESEDAREERKVG